MSVSVHIDTKDQNRAKVALVLHGKSYQQESKSTMLKSQMVLVLLVKLLERHNLTFDQITEVVVALGPGSFTGLRVGCAVANALGFLLDVPVNGKRDIVTPQYS